MECVTLIGAEDIRKAGNTMKAAADDMRNAANTISEALSIHQRWAEDLLCRMESLIDTKLDKLRDCANTRTSGKTGPM